MLKGLWETVWAHVSWTPVQRQCGHVSHGPQSRVSVGTCLMDPSPGSRKQGVHPPTPASPDHGAYGSVSPVMIREFPFPSFIQLWLIKSSQCTDIWEKERLKMKALLSTQPLLGDTRATVLPTSRVWWAMHITSSWWWSISVLSLEFWFTRSPGSGRWGRCQPQLYCLHSRGELLSFWAASMPSSCSLLWHIMRMW